jgi:hypothetical protein
VRPLTLLKFGYGYELINLASRKAVSAANAPIDTTLLAPFKGG